MADDELHLETKEFDFAVFGTGLTECLVSAYANTDHGSALRSLFLLLLPFSCSFLTPIPS